MARGSLGGRLPLKVLTFSSPVIVVPYRTRPGTPVIIVCQYFEPGPYRIVHGDWRSPGYSGHRTRSCKPGAPPPGPGPASRYGAGNSGTIGKVLDDSNCLRP
eukprot:767157-Hanusia_phi.AAC.12